MRSLHATLMLPLLAPLAALAPAARADAGGAPQGAGGVRYSLDIRPILSEHCFACHGPDEKGRKAKLRLDTREGLLRRGENGPILKPGDPAGSELFARVTARDPDERMPPIEHGKPLDDRQIELVRKWIEQGGAWERHWSFASPVRPPLPEVKDKAWPRNPIDAFVLARLEGEGLRPSPPAGKAALLRRVTLDLTGLPPTPAEVDAFLADASPEAYEKVVDRLLAGPRYGEKMAMRWLDAARYADTNGYNNDDERDMWPWRDWVIGAFNANLPYDRFLTEQLAGDLLPDPTLAQKIATGFNRNHVMTTEGGVVEEEYRVEYVVDRASTTANVFLGLTFQCARCHDHKFDPTSQKDFYRFYAYFNHLPDRAVAPGQKTGDPVIKAPSAEQSAELERLARRRQELEGRLRQREGEVDDAVAAWEQSLRSAAPGAVGDVSGGPAYHFPLDETAGADVGDAVDPARKGTVVGKAAWTAGKVGGALEFDGATHVDLGPLAAFERTDAYTAAAWVYLAPGAAAEAVAILSKMDDDNGYRGYDLLLEQGRPVAHVVHHYPDNYLKVVARQPLAPGAWRHVAVVYDGSSRAAGLHLYVDGVPQEVDVRADHLSDTVRTDKPLHVGRRGRSLPFKGKIDDVRIYAAALSAADVARLAGGDPVVGLASVLNVPAARRSAAQAEQVRRAYLEAADGQYRKLKADLAEAAARTAEVEKAAPTMMVMRDMFAPRETHLLKRGAYDAPGEVVTAGVPDWLLPMTAGAPANRLGLARWLTDPAHPLTARVAVNRFWESVFGIGLVKTAEDFGLQGEQPSHPQLLDWLATEFIGTGWDVKRLMKLLVTSAAYRQSSDAPPSLYERDPENRLLARGPRVRLAAESVRDNALFVSGLLKERVGGPSVRPYQPPGLWEEVSVSHQAVYKPDKGEGLYRRSLYTFWKRTCPPPAMTTFDAPDREYCVIRRGRTNTPLQALVLMNDPQFVEAARKLAERMAAEGGATPEARLARGFKLSLAREPADAERAVLLPIYEKSLARFRADPAAADKLLAVGESPRDKNLDGPELAAWTTVANMLLGLDETITN